MPVDENSAERNERAGRAPETELTPELVRVIAEKVYRMIIQEMSIDRERSRVSHSTDMGSRGG